MLLSSPAVSKQLTLIILLINALFHERPRLTTLYMLFIFNELRILFLAYKCHEHTKGFHTIHEETTVIWTTLLSHTVLMVAGEADEYTVEPSNPYGSKRPLTLIY